MNVLLARIRSTLAELDLGLKGDLTMSEPMERLMQARSFFDVSNILPHGNTTLVRGISACMLRNAGPAYCKPGDPLATVSPSCCAVSQLPTLHYAGPGQQPSSGGLGSGRLPIAAAAVVMGAQSSAARRAAHRVRH